ncbi:MAG: nitrate reductase [Planctomycetota bacterium]
MNDPIPNNANPHPSGPATPQDRATPSLPVLNQPTKVGRATCTYCGVGCVVNATVEQDRVTAIHADPEAEPNHGMLCPKGALLRSITGDAPGRLRQPMIREQRGGPLREVTWDVAADYVARRLLGIHTDHGPDALALYGSGQLDTEASYLFTKLFKGYLRCNHTDTNSRLCMSSAVAGYVKAFGSDGPPTCYDDIDDADVFLIVGANMAANHPVLFNRVRRRRALKATSRVIVIDPRKCKTAEYADLHLPVAPGGDVALLRLIAKRLLERGKVDRRYTERSTEGMAVYEAGLEREDEAELLRASGVSDAAVEEAVDLIAAGSPRLLSFYCMGANQSSRGTDKNSAIINLHLQLGAIGRRGAGPFSLTGQPNAMGGREVGYLSHQLPGYRLIANEAHRTAVEAGWGLEPGTINPEPGMTAVPMFNAAAAGDVKAMWIVCTNPVASMPDKHRVVAGLEKAEFVIAQDCMLDTETTRYADVLLPAAQWGEKSGTMTNSERLVMFSEKLIEPPGEAKPDWWVFAKIGRAMGFDGFDFVTSAEVWDEYRKLTAGTLCDQAGMTRQRLEDAPLRWPCPTADHPGTARRYTTGRFPTPTSKARFVDQKYAPPAETVNPRFPLVLTTGRVAQQWHTRTKTGRVRELNLQTSEPFVEVHPEDAEAFELEHDSWAWVIGRRGRATARVEVTDTVRRGLVFVPFHWGETFHPQTNINASTSPAFDAVSKQPELKYAAVRLEPAGLHRPDVDMAADRRDRTHAADLDSDRLADPQPISAGATNQYVARVKQPSTKTTVASPAGEAP